MVVGVGVRRIRRDTVNERTVRIPVNLLLLDGYKCHSMNMK